MLRQASARPEQHLLPNNLTHIARDAIRAAALAPNADAALDVAGAALSAIADTARAAPCDRSPASPHNEIPLRLTKAIQRACLLFSLIEASAGSPADLRQALVLSQVGRELMAAAASDFEQLLERTSRGGVSHG